MAVRHELAVAALTDLLFEEPGLGRCLVAPDGSVLRANAEWLRSTGFPLDDVLGADVIGLFPETRDMALAMHARARAGHRIDVPRHAQRVHGRDMWCEGSIAPVPMDGGTGLLITTREVSRDPPVLGRDLASAPGDPDIVAAVLDTIASLVVVLDTAGRIVRFNAACERATGYSACEVVGKVVFDVFVTGDDLPGVRATFERLRSGDFPNRHQNRWRTKDGSERLLDWANTCVLDERGDVKYVIGTATDVTERAQSEQALRASESRFRTLADNAPDLIARFDRELRHVFVNEAAARASGIPAGRFIAKTHRELGMPPELVSIWEARLRSVFETWRTTAFEFASPAPGGVKYFEARVVPELGPDGTVQTVLAVTRDVTERQQAEERLRHSEERLRLALAASRSGTFDWDARTDKFDWSDELLALYGLTGGGTVGRREDWLECLVPEDREAAVAALERALETGDFALEFRIRRPDTGEIRWMEGRGRVFFDSERRPQRMAGLNLDVSDRKRAEEALLDAEERARSRAMELEVVLDTVPAAVWIAHDREGNDISANRFGAELLRTPPRTNVSVTAPTAQRPTNFRPTKDGTDIRPDDLPIQAAARFGKEFRDFEFDVTFDDGTVRHLLGNSSPLCDSGGARRGSVGAFIDITDRKRAERDAELLARLPKENPDPVLRLDRDLTILYANDAARARLRPLGVGDGAAAPPEIAGPARQALQEGRRVVTEIAFGDLAFSLSVVPIEGKVNVYAQDITARKLAVEALDRKRALLASVMQATDVMLVYLDPDFDFVWVNAAYAAGCDMRPDEMIGKNHFDLFPHAENEAIFRRVRDTGEPVFFKDKPFEFLDQPHRGVTYWDWSLVPVKDAAAKVQGLVFSLRETTKYKRAELELDAERMRWRGVVEGIADEVWVCDVSGRMSLINLPDTTGMGLEEFEGKAIEEVLQEVEILYPDGRPRPRDEAPLLRSMRSGEIVRGEEIMRHRRSGRVRCRQFSCAPMRDGAGAVTGAVAIVRDVTDSKRTEEALREADRRKDEFLAMLSHELRNPLAPIRNSIYLLRHARAGSEQAARAQTVIERQTGHLTRLVDDLLDVTRIARGKVELRRSRIDLRAVVLRAADDFRLVMRDRTFRVALADAELWADADATRITQVIGNLLHNASKFTRAGDEVTLSLAASGSWAEIRVRDTGAGIDAALLPTIFEPFVQGEHTLARTEGGLGLGLALVKGVAELHGGVVLVESAGRGKGAEFVVRLPLLDRGTDATWSCDATRSEDRVRVLVVDDNADTAESLADIVRMLGYDVAVAYDGHGALEEVRAHPPNVILCDIGLPGMSGYDVAKAIRTAGVTGIQLIAVSGYAQPEDVKRAVEAGFDAHVAKPADPAEIERLLAR